jgi:hypothetical protein
LKNVELLKRILFSKEPLSYKVVYEFFCKLAAKSLKTYQDLSEYRVTQIFDESGSPKSEFYLSSRSIQFTTFRVFTIEEMQAFNLSFMRSEYNHGIYSTSNKAKVVRYWGRKKQIVNTPYLIDVKFGDYLVFTNGLMLIVPKEKFKSLYK